MFTDRLDVRLICLVRDNPVLYDVNHPKYMDFNAREVAWQRIGDELKRPGEFTLRSARARYRGQLDRLSLSIWGFSFV